MIDIEQFITDYITGKTAQQLADELFNAAGTGDPAGGFITAYNEAVNGKDVKDDITSMALLQQAYWAAVLAATAAVTNLASKTTVTGNDVAFAGDVFAGGDKPLFRYVGGTGAAGSGGARSDMNNVRDTGIYYQNTTNVPANAATQLACVYAVFSYPNAPSDDTERVIQIAITKVGNLAYRSMINSSTGWTEWATAASKSYVNDTVSEKFGYVGGLSDNEDMNDVKNSGIYYQNRANVPAHAATQNPCIYAVFAYPNPTTQAMERVIQLAITQTGNLAYRSKINTDSGWTEWTTAANRDTVNTEIESIKSRIDEGCDPGFVMGRTEEQVTVGETTYTGYRDVPSSSGCMKAYKKAHQLIDLQWTNTSRITTYTNRSGGGVHKYNFEPGEHTGMPYSSVKETETYVPQDVSLRTFMTALQNPRSLIYTDNVYANPVPDTGETLPESYFDNYNGIPACGPYYGAVCSSFVLYALGIRTRWATDHFAYLCKRQILYKPAEQSAAGVELMDIVWRNGHCAIVTDIYRDSRGRPIVIKVSEAASSITAPGPVVQETAYTAAEFDSERIQSDNGIIYRYAALRSNIQYEMSDYVRVDDEAQVLPPAANDDICTFAGDYASFGMYMVDGDNERVRFPIIINAKKSSSYTKLVVRYGAGPSVDEIPLTGNADEWGDYDVTEYCTNAGKYYAWLETANGDESAWTHFEIVDNRFHYDFDAEATSANWYKYPVKIIFEGSLAKTKALYAELVSIAGETRGIYEFTDSDRSSGTVTIDWYSIAKEQLAMTFNSGSNKYLRVVYQGEYGRVTYKPQLVYPDISSSI